MLRLQRINSKITAKKFGTACSAWERETCPVVQRCVGAEDYLGAAANLRLTIPWPAVGMESVEVVGVC